MSDFVTILLVGVPSLLILTLISARAVRTRWVPQRMLAKARLNESAFDWIMHFAVGLMMLGVFTVLAFASTDRPHPLIGIFSGSMAAALAFATARPPMRVEARNPELDGPLITISAVVHVSTAVLLLIGLA